jgi:hypothetical protein
MDKDASKQLADSLRANNLLDATKKVDKKKPEVHIGHDEFKAMKKSKYQETKSDFDTSYVIQNKRTGQIVEVKAISPILAAKTVGWRPRHVKVLQVNESSDNSDENTED